MRVAVTLIGAAVAVVIAMGGSHEALQFDRAAIAGGGWWRVITGHFTHWSLDHFVWDLLVFVAAGVVAETLSRRRMVLCVAVSSLAISGAVWVMLPEMVAYRGLSGIDSALFSLVVVSIAREAWSSGRRGVAGAMAVAGLLFMAKVGYELLTGATLFVDSAASGFEPVPLAHGVGAAAGGVIGGWPMHRKQGESTSCRRSIRTFTWPPSVMTSACSP